jgi:hypothetical protein
MSKRQISYDAIAVTLCTCIAFEPGVMAVEDFCALTARATGWCGLSATEPAHIELFSHVPSSNLASPVTTASTGTTNVAMRPRSL